MMIMSEKEARDKKNAVLKVLSLLFPSFKIFITPTALSFMQGEESIVIDSSNFEAL